MKGILKSRLPVILISNRKTWVTKQIFSEWYSKHLCHSVLQFCNLNNLLPRKVLLLLDRAPGDPPNLEDVNSELKVKIVFPPNTTSLLQPMNQAVIAAFKAYYLRQSLQEMIWQTDTSGVFLKEYWKDYNILKAIDNIKMAWEEVTVSCMKGVWHNIWPSNENYGRNCDCMDMLIKDTSRRSWSWHCWSCGHRWSFRKALSATVQWRTLWLGPTIDWTAEGKWRWGGSWNQRSADEGHYCYSFSCRYSSWKVMWYRPWLGTQLYSKKGHKRPATPLLWNTARKEGKIKTAEVTFFLVIFWTTAWAFCSKIKSDLIDIFIYMCNFQYT